MLYDDTDDGATTEDVDANEEEVVDENEEGGDSVVDCSAIRCWRTERRTGETRYSDPLALAWDREAGMESSTTTEAPWAMSTSTSTSPLEELEPAKEADLRPPLRDEEEEVEAVEDDDDEDDWRRGDALVMKEVEATLLLLSLLVEAWEDGSNAEGLLGAAAEEEQVEERSASESRPNSASSMNDTSASPSPASTPSSSPFKGDVHMLPLSDAAYEVLAREELGPGEKGTVAEGSVGNALTKSKEVSAEKVAGGARKGDFEAVAEGVPDATGLVLMASATSTRGPSEYPDVLEGELPAVLLLAGEMPRGGATTSGPPA